VSIWNLPGGTYRSAQHVRGGNNGGSFERDVVEMRFSTFWTISLVRGANLGKGSLEEAKKEDGIEDTSVEPVWIRRSSNCTQVESLSRLSALTNI
jgi:hypothetical protein